VCDQVLSMGRDLKVNKLRYLLSGKLLNVSLMMCKGIEAYL
jgi:hypothetical protein